MGAFEFRSVVPGDIDQILALNQSELPAVSSLDRRALERLVEMSTGGLVALAVADDDDSEGPDIAAFALVLGPGADYASENYAWFSSRFADFAYLDRVVVAPTYRRRRLGSDLYAEIERRCNAPWFCLEVNIEPRNEVSLRFHERLGFSAVGEQRTEGGAKTVRLMAKPLAPSAVERSRSAQESD